MRAIYLAGLISATTLPGAPQSARADTCSSAAECSRHVACAPGFTKRAKNRRFLCTRTTKPGATTFALSELSTGTVSAGSAKRCADASRCGKAVSCPVGFRRYTLGNKYYCSRVAKAVTTTPTCRRHKRRSDWRWSSSTKKCTRGKSRTDRVYTSENINCPDGFAFRARFGACEKAAATIYRKALLR